jgi:hypothetical protein
MKQTSFIAILLTLLMFLLVTIAAVVFLVQRNQELSQAVEVQSSDQEALAKMSEEMATDLAVRKAALESAEATREALAGQIETDRAQIQDLEEELNQTESTLSQTENKLQDRAVQLFIFSPKDGAMVPPLEPVELFVAARSDAGVETIEITVDGETLVRYPSEGQPTSTLRTEWTPPEEGEYLVNAVARDGDGRLSEPETVTIRAAFSSPAARTSALRSLTEKEVLTLRFPEPLESITQTEAAEASPVDLHTRLLAGQGEGERPFSADEVLVLQALELLPADIGVDELANPAYDGSILAYYDPEEEQLTLYEPGDQPETFGRWAHIHDFSHQILDESFQLDSLEINTLNRDARAALRALLEGEATYLQYLYAEGDTLEPEQQSEIFEGLSSATSNALDDLPQYLQDDFAFAYVEGLLFVQSLHDGDGYEALNEAWSNLPESTEQILHPDRYLAGDEPIAVTIDPLGEGFENWRMVGEDVLGEFQLRQHLQGQGLPKEQIDQAATGWGGGRYAVYQNEGTGDLILLMRLAWDTPADRDEFTTTYGTTISQRYGDQGVALPGGDLCWEGEDATCLLTPAGDTLIVRGPDLETVNAVIANQ